MNPHSKVSAYNHGRTVVRDFCELNYLPTPTIIPYSKSNWDFPGTCAYYRPTTIHICIDECAYSCRESLTRNWNWPGNTTDREPFGVLCHELGHHVDVIYSTKGCAYYGDYSKSIKSHSKEQPITSYCPNWGEWFAEIFRLFVTNHALLELLRPKTYKILRDQFYPIGSDHWLENLGPKVPDRIVQNLLKKIR